MKPDWKTTYCLVVSIVAFVLVSVTTTDMYDARQDAAYWETRYELLFGTLVDGEFDPDLVPSIEPTLWARPDIRARAYTYLARWAQVTPAAETSLNALWQTEHDDGLRAVAETGLRRAPREGRGGLE